MSDIYTMTISEFAKYLAEFFKEEPHKITLWWLTENPHFGGISPASFYIHRPEKAMKVFESMARGDTRG